MRRRAARRVGLVVAGLVMGLLVTAIAASLYVRAAQVKQAGAAIAADLSLPSDVLTVEKISPTGRLRIALRDVAILDARGDTIVAAPVARLNFDPSSLGGPGPIEFDGVELRSPLARLVQDADGEWNIVGAMRMEAGGREVGGLDGEGDEEQPILLRNVRIVDGRLLIAMPAEAPDTAGFAAGLNLPLTRMGGAWYQSYALRDVDATLPRVRFGGEAGWRAELASMDARLVEPDLRIARMSGVAEASGLDGVRFRVAALDFGESSLTAEGTVRFPENADAAIYDARVRVERLAFADLARLIPTVPEGGTAQFALDVRTRDDGRTELRVSDLQAVAMDSRIAGTLGMVVGGEASPTFMDTRLALDPLRLAALEQLGLVEEMPFLGEVTGTVATDGATTSAGALALDLAATLVPRGEPDAEPSRIAVDGEIALAEGEEPLRLNGLRVQLRPLRLESLASLLPEQRDRLRGELRGVVTLTGTPSALRAEGGEVAYQVGSAEPTILTGVEGEFTLQPELRYRLKATARPLALASLTELFPALPFRTATLAGPIDVEGGADGARFGLDLGGRAGAVQLSGSATFGEPLRFDVEGRVRSFTAAAVLRGELPVEGPVTGTFAARGNAEDFFFNVDLAQTAGKFALSGRVRLPGGSPEVAVGGRVENFRLGALIGRPGLFASPLTGTVQLNGGGAGPLRFDVDLAGDVGRFDLAGFYRPGEVPEYEARGDIAGLDLRRLPFGDALPHTALTGRLELVGRGTTPETLAGSLSLDARGSSVGGLPVDAALIRAQARDGILRVDTLEVRLRETRLSAAGMWGLTRPAPEPLDFTLVSPNLATVSRLIATPQLIQPRLEGALRVQGAVSGSVRYPVVVAGVRGRRLRYEDWQVGNLTLSLEAARGERAGWGGEAALTADGLELAGGQKVQSLRLQVDGDQSALAVDLLARRDGQNDVSVSGIVELEGTTPRGLVLDSLSLRFADAGWRLLDRARIRWGGVDGVLVENLALRRSGDGTGMIRMNGQLPPDGDVSFRVEAAGVDLGDVRRLIGESAPAIGGRLTLDALLEGPVGGPDLTLRAEVDSLSYQGVRADRLALRGEYLQEVMALGAEVWMRGRQVAMVDAEVPMQLSLRNLVPGFELLRQAPLRAEVRTDSLPLELVTAFVPQLSQGGGVAEAQVTVGGTLDLPELAGTARVRGGTARVEPLGITYSQINGRASLAGNTVRLDSLTVRSGGTLGINGSIQFDQGRGPLVYLTAEMDGFRLMDEKDLATVNASGRVALSGDMPTPVLTGSLSLRETTITIPELATFETSTVEITDVEVGQIGADTLAGAGILPPLLAGMRIDALEVDVGESVWLVSKEARIQIDGDLVLYRTGEELKVFGLLQAVRGTYALEIGSIIREFDIRSGRVQFFGTGDLNPSLDIVAANRVRTGGVGTGDEITILVNIGGTLFSPRLRLASDTPTPLSESELFSLLVFGRPSFALGGVGSRSFAQQIFVQELLGGILATELERPFLSSGICDYVRVQPGITSLQGLDPRQEGQLLNTLSAATIECGREIGDEIFATFRTGIGALVGGEASTLEWGVGLEWQIDREWMLEISYGPVPRPFLLQSNPVIPYQLSTDIRRSWEYGKPRTRTPLELAPPDSLPGEIRR